ncbi:MAG: hypothetical protein RAK22_02470, partial [Nanoarchaeota archaeon]|nr:hypothetical protein [Nanoarchaeota archaeon]
FSTLLVGLFLRNILYSAGLFARDINKRNKPLLPTSGGIAVAAGFFIGMMAFVFSYNFIVSSGVNLLILLTVLLSTLSVTFVGLLDDLLGGRVRLSSSIKGIGNYVRANGGLKQWQKPLLTLVAAIPVMAIHFGPPAVTLPLVGTIFFGQIIYTFIVIPIAMIFSSNVFNMLEGLNGLSLQMSLVAFIAILIFAYHTGDVNAIVLSSIFISTLVAYLYFGAYPAKFLPGDSLTYFIGAGFASLAIMTNIKAFALVLIIPWIAEFFLKARAHFHAHSWGIIQKDGTLKSLYGDRVYSLTHLFLRTGKFKEWQIVLFFTLIEVFFSALALAFFW